MDSSQPGPASAGLLVLVGGTAGSEKVCPDHNLQVLGVVEKLAAAMDPMEVTRAVSRLRRRTGVCVERQRALVETAWAEAEPTSEV